MTDIKLIADKVPSLTGLSQESLAPLELPEDAENFLNSPYRKKLMIEFSIGSNKLSLYGQPFVMAKYSELIETNIPIYADSTPPFPLLTHGVVLERPMSVLWAMMNGYDLIITDAVGTPREERLSDKHSLKAKGLTITELLHMYRLANYFGLNGEMTIQIIREVLQTIAETKFSTKQELSENDKRSLEVILSGPNMPYYLFFPVWLSLYRNIPFLQLDPKYTDIVRFNVIDSFVMNWTEEVKDPEDQKLIAQVLNEFLSKPEQINYKKFLEGDSGLAEDFKDANKGEIITTVLDFMFIEIDKNVEIKKLINYKPIYVVDKLATYADKSIWVRHRTLGRLNTGWKSSNARGDEFTKQKGGNSMTIFLRVWTQDKGIIEIVQQSQSLKDFTADTGGVLLNPIVP